MPRKQKTNPKAHISKVKHELINYLKNSNSLSYDSLTASIEGIRPDGVDLKAFSQELKPQVNNGITILLGGNNVSPGVLSKHKGRFISGVVFTNFVVADFSNVDGIDLTSKNMPGDIDKITIGVISNDSSIVFNLNEIKRVGRSYYSVPTILNLPSPCSSVGGPGVPSEVDTLPVKLLGETIFNIRKHKVKAVQTKLNENKPPLIGNSTDTLSLSNICIELIYSNSKNKWE